MPALRVIFMGTAEISCVIFQALLRFPAINLLGVVTQPDRPKGRDLKLQPSPVKILASREHLPVLQPERARDPGFLTQLRDPRPDLIVVAAYGQILPKDLLDLPHFGCINVHTSLLPKYRGAGPIQWAILNDEAETGITIMKMDAGMDTGEILSQECTPILPEDNAQSLHDRLAQIGAALLLRTIPEYVSGKIEPKPQSAEGVSFAPKIKKEDGRLDWTMPARAIWNRVRGLVPWPGAFTILPDQPSGHLLKIWRAEITELSGGSGEILRADKSGIVVGCGRESLRLLELQREGGRRLSAQQFLAGHPLMPGQKLG
jgi:methionyl-tRNA formyltransferase